MKKILLATAAVMALTATAAQAEIKLDLGGFFKGYAGYADQDTANLRSFDFKRRSQIFFSGETTLDNGLTVGYKGDLFQEATDTIDDPSNTVERSFLYFSGNWGRVNMGRETGAAYLLQVSAPSADANIDGQDIAVSFFNASGNVDQDYQASGPNSTSNVQAGLNARDNYKFSDKVTYLTPKFNGFQAGVSYSPEADRKLYATNGGIGDAGSLGGMQADNTTSDLEDLMDVAARYDGEFNGVGIHAGAGYTTAGVEVENGTATAFGSDDYKEWNTGLKLTYDAFGIGAAYNTDNGAADTLGDTDTWVLGADYTWGAYKFGASYLNSQGEAGVANTQDDELDRYTVGATYTFGPGMDFRGAVAFYDLDRAATVNDNEATVVTVGTDIQF